MYMWAFIILIRLLPLVFLLLHIESLYVVPVNPIFLYNLLKRD